MAKWQVLGVLAILATAYADDRLTFPELARASSSRIVSGWEAEEGQFPFQLSIRMINPVGGVSACGATIIHPEWALTAAHCTATRVSFVIRAGTVNLTRPFMIFETTYFVNYPEYDESIQTTVQPHDIGVIGFGRSIEYNEYIQPIRMQSSYQKNKNYQGQRLTASGWGVVWTSGAAPENMNWVFLTGVSNTFCRNSFGGSSIIVDSTICAGAYNVTSQSTCSGDSGGALTVVDDDGLLTQVGVSSFVSSTGCHTDFPAGFIRPGHYHAWYKEVTGIDFDWMPETTEEPTTTTTTESPQESESSESSEEETPAEPVHVIDIWA